MGQRFSGDRSSRQLAIIEPILTRANRINTSCSVNNRNNRRDNNSHPKHGRRDGHRHGHRRSHHNFFRHSHTCDNVSSPKFCSKDLKYPHRYMLFLFLLILVF